jgi:hypothetical protein
MSEAPRWFAVPEGADFVEYTKRELAGESGWLHAHGVIEGVELAIPAQTNPVRRVLEGRALMVSCVGPARGPFSVVLARAAEGRRDPGAPETFSGWLVRGRVLEVTAVVTPVPAMIPAQALPEPPVLRRVSASPSPLGAEEVAATSRWAAAAAASAAAAEEATEAAEVDEEDNFPAAGDRVQHFAFGLCDVLMSDGESLKIRDVREHGRIREIRADVLLISKPALKDGKRVFKLTRRS